MPWLGTCAGFAGPQLGGQPPRHQSQTEALRAQFLVGDLPVDQLMALLCQVHGLEAVAAASDLRILLGDAADEVRHRAHRHWEGRGWGMGMCTV